jgi:hypothetical protein
VPKGIMAAEGDGYNAIFSFGKPADKIGGII